MATLDSLVTEVTAEVHALSYPLALKLLRESARDFFSATRAWRHTVTDDPLLAGNNEVFLALPADSTVHDVQYIRINGDKDLVRSTEARLSRHESSTSPQYYIMDYVYKVIRIHPAVTEDSTVDYQLILRPSPSATTIQDHLVDRFQEPLVYGALYRAFRMPGKRWSDRATASHYLDMAEIAKHAAMSVAEDDNQKGVVRKVRYGGY